MTYEIVFKLHSAVRIENEVLRTRFEKCVSDLSLQLEPEHLRIARGFHGTNPRNLEGISKNGLLKVGNPLNPSKETDKGYFGNPHYGVYVSIYIHTHTHTHTHTLKHTHIHRQTHINTIIHKQTHT